MFQYAVAKSLAISFDVPLRFDLEAYKKTKQHQGFLLDKLFDIQIIPASRLDISEVIGWYGGLIPKNLFYKYSPLIKFGRNIRNQNLTVSPSIEKKKFNNPCYLKGWWQSEQFFEKHKQKIAEDFYFTPLLDEKNKSISENMKQMASLSVHVRRGDYVATTESKKSYAVCEVKYYHKAFNEILKMMDIEKAYIFSDDISWVKKNLTIPFNYEFVEHNTGINSYRDMHLMTFCRAHIVANSSFSWWGAWLAEAWGKSSGLVIAPEKWGLKAPMPVEVPPSRWMLI
jgi:hypothetical protein